VTAERVEAESQSVESFLRSLEHEFPPPKDEAEVRRRSSIFNEVAGNLLMGSLIAVREFMPAHARALTRAAQRFGEAKLAGGTPKFAVRGGYKDRSFVETLGGVSLVALHEKITEGLRAIWKLGPTLNDVVPSWRFVSPTGRYGERQHRGYQRRQAILRTRADTLQAVIRKLTRDKVLINDPTARRLVQSCKGPADLSLAAIAELTGKSKRTVKAHLIERRRGLGEYGKAFPSTALLFFANWASLDLRER
jgi:hypothetical protein